ncbi:unnamed protein product [Calicophoron daubneyi]|uniref:G-patch domain-containing protein n=1 Tax=Calicophoron daubneyi TaxID=300641 RepID=A0AAV2TJ41_CALDB
MDKDVTLLRRHFVHGGNCGYTKSVPSVPCEQSKDASGMSGCEARSFYESLFNRSQEIKSVDEQSSSGPNVCPVCGGELVPGFSMATHLSSLGHQVAELSAQPKRPSALFIPPSNVGYQLLAKIGWSDPAFVDNEQHAGQRTSTESVDSSSLYSSPPVGGLGPRGQGRRNPISTVLKRDRYGLGWTATDSKPRVTHFPANDVKAIQNIRGINHPRVNLDSKFHARESAREKLRERRLREKLNFSDEHYFALYGR